MRKNETMPENLDPEQIEEIFQRIKDYPETPQSKRVEQILELLSSFREGLRGVDKGQIKVRLDRILSDYRWCVRVTPLARGLLAIHFPADREKLSEDDQWGYRAVGILIQLMPSLGKRSRIRRCAECGKWFFAAKRDDERHRHCSGNCRQRGYDSSPQMREYKRRYMRDYREEEKKREGRRKVRAGFRGRVVHRAKKSLR
jgi:hypothetical protein